MQTTAPSQPLVSGTLALEEVCIDTHLVQLLDHGLCTEVLLRTTTHEEIMYLLVEVRTLEDTISNGLDIHAEESA